MKDLRGKAKNKTIYGKKENNRKSEGVKKR